MRKLKLILAAVIITLLMIPTLAFAAQKEGIIYTAIGDSIAYGTGGTGGVGYVDLLNDHLEQVYGEGIFNECTGNGVTSGGLYFALTNDAAPSFEAMNDAVTQANIITISIGGNDILQPVIGVNPNILQSMTPAEIQGLQISLYNNYVASFAEKWSLIITRIRAINPTAEIYVNTLYNPFKPGDVLNQFADPLIQGINQPILAEALTFDYQVVDVYTEFSEYKNPVIQLVHDLDSPVAVHPTDRGYKFIYEMHKHLINTGTR